MSLKAIALLGISSLLGTTAHVAAEDPVRTLHVLNWSFYIDESPDADESLPITERSPTLKAFEEEYGCRINYIEYDSEDEAIAYLALHPGAVDVFNINQFEMLNMADSGMLRPLDGPEFTNRRYIDQSILKRFYPGDQARFISPWQIGTTGILYRKDLSSQDFRSWKHFFEPDESSRGKIGLLNSAVSALGAAILYAGVETVDAFTVRDAALLVRDLTQSGVISSISSDIESTTQKLNAGELHAALLYSGDAISAIEEFGDDRFAFVNPAEGVEVYMDAWCSPIDAPNPDLADAFINFLSRPDIHGNNSKYLNYLSPNAVSRIELEKDEDYRSLVGEIDDEFIASSFTVYDDTLSTTFDLYWQKILESLNR